MLLPMKRFRVLGLSCIMLLAACSTPAVLEVLAPAAEDPLVQAVGSNFDRVGTDPVTAAAQLNALRIRLGNGNPRDVELLIFLASRCSVDRACASPHWAERWTSIEPDNGAAWVFLAGALRDDGQDELAASALNRAANSPRFDTHYRQFVNRLRQAVMARTASRLDATTEAIRVAADLPATWPSLCAFDARSARKPVCERLGQLMATTATTMIDRASGLLYWRQNSIDPEALVQDETFLAAAERLDAFLYASGELLPEWPFNTPEDRQRMILWVDDLIDNGELVASANLLARSGLTEAQAAGRYRDRLRALQNPPATK
jgi:hypothetical protein